MKKVVLYTILSLLFLNAKATEEIFKAVEDSISLKEKVTGAFKSTRVINAHSIEMLSRHNLDFRIMHRFGFVSDGIKQFFGLDAASFRKRHRFFFIQTSKL